MLIYSFYLSRNALTPVNIWPSYCQNKKGAIFYDSQRRNHSESSNSVEDFPIYRNRDRKLKLRIQRITFAAETNATRVQSRLSIATCSRGSAHGHTDAERHNTFSAR